MNSDVQISRRQVVAGAGVAAGALTIAACSSPSVTYTKPTAGSSSAGTATAGSTTTAQPAPAQEMAPEPPANVITTTADVPVGGGVIVDDVVVTQETAGDFKAFSSVCTHRGCSVESVSGGGIVCPCHGSLFTLDGSVVSGPASRPLRSVAITVDGGNIIRS